MKTDWRAKMEDKYTVQKYQAERATLERQLAETRTLSNRFLATFAMFANPGRGDYFYQNEATEERKTYSEHVLSRFNETKAILQEYVTNPSTKNNKRARAARLLLNMLDDENAVYKSDVGHKNLDNTLCLMAMVLNIKDDSLESRSILREILAENKFSCHPTFFDSSDCNTSASILGNVGGVFAGIGGISFLGTLVTGILTLALLASVPPVGLLIALGVFAAGLCIFGLLAWTCHTMAKSQVNDQLTAEIKSAFDLDNDMGREHSPDAIPASTPGEYQSLLNAAPTSGHDVTMENQSTKLEFSLSKLIFGA